MGLTLQSTLPDRRSRLRVTGMTPHSFLIACSDFFYVNCRTIFCIKINKKSALMKREVGDEISVKLLSDFTYINIGFTSLDYSRLTTFCYVLSNISKSLLCGQKI